MTLTALASKFNQQLKPSYDAQESEVIFLLAVEKLLHYKRITYLSRKNEEITPVIAEQFESILAQLQKGIPIQYILGETEFYRLPIKVNNSVLIPRPETEELVAWILSMANSFRGGAQEKATLNLLDIGTGSGCIAIALKKHLPDVNVSALDVSAAALAVATENAKLNEVTISFFEHNILSPQHDRADLLYDVIVSNPPYITLAEKTTMHENVLANEPHLALFAQQDRPLIFYEAIADFAQLNLKPNGLIYFEINEHLANETIKLLEDKGFNNITLKKDMQRKDRMLCCSKIKTGDGIG